MTVDIYLDPLTKVIPVTLLSYNVELVFPPFHTMLFGRKLRLGWNIYIIYLKIFRMDILFSLVHSLLKLLYKLGWTHTLTLYLRL